jgi:SpoVK/Ycf46/Vps4 family AAA+-type ATPase
MVLLHLHILQSNYNTSLHNNAQDFVCVSSLQSNNSNEQVVINDEVDNEVLQAIQREEMLEVGFKEQVLKNVKVRYDCETIKQVSFLAYAALKYKAPLDMIVDLLIILDKVRSYRGFVVFASTSSPTLLDPALRRPGRFDEVITLR